MGIADYQIDLAEARHSFAQFKATSQRYRKRLMGLDRVVKRIVASDSITGQTGDSLKAYLQDVHLPLIRALVEALNSMEIDYMTHFLMRFEGAPIHEGGSSALSAMAMKRAENSLESVETETLWAVQERIDAAAEAMPAGYSAPFPDTSGIRSLVEEARRDIDRTRLVVGELDESGAHTMSNRYTSTKRLHSHISGAIVQIRRVDLGIKTYKKGTLRPFEVEEGLADAVSESAKNTKENAPLVDELSAQILQEEVENIQASKEQPTGQFIEDPAPQPARAAAVPPTPPIQHAIYTVPLEEKTPAAEHAATVSGEASKRQETSFSVETPKNTAEHVTSGKENASWSEPQESSKLFTGIPADGKPEETSEFWNSPSQTPAQTDIEDLIPSADDAWDGEGQASPQEGSMFDILGSVEEQPADIQDPIDTELDGVLGAAESEDAESVGEAPAETGNIDGAGISGAAAMLDETLSSAEQQVKAMEEALASIEEIAAYEWGYTPVEA